MLNLAEALDREAEKRIKQYPHPSNRASECGHPCKRFLVLARTHTEKLSLHEVGLQRIFDEGNLHEEAVLRELQDAGFKLVEQQRPFQWRKFQLSGRIDAKISLNGELIPLEIKSCSPNVFAHIKPLSSGDLIHSKYPWVRKYPAQLQAYMIMDSKEHGIILFKNKSTGEKSQKDFTLDMDFIEPILKKLEEVNGYIARNEIPPVEMSEECKRCGFQKIMCFPGQDYGPGFDFLSDEETEAKLIKWDQLKESAKEYQELDKELKGHFKGKCAIVGDFKIESKEHERKTYPIPIEVKEKYLEIGTYFRTSIERL